MWSIPLQISRQFHQKQKEKAWCPLVLCLFILVMRCSQSIFLCLKITRVCMTLSSRGALACYFHKYICFYSQFQGPIKSTARATSVTSIARYFRRPVLNVCWNEMFRDLYFNRPCLDCRHQNTFPV